MKCKWKDVAEDIECFGLVQEVDLFPGLISPQAEQEVEDDCGASVHKMPICQAHLQVHLDIFRAHIQGIDVEENLDMTAQERKNRISKD